MGTKNAVDTWTRRPRFLLLAVCFQVLMTFQTSSSDAQHVLVRLCRQAEHKVELDVVPAAGKGRGAGGENLLFGDVFIDDVPQPLGTGLRCKGQAAFADLLQLLHQLIGEVVGPQRGQRHIDFPRRTEIQQSAGQRLELPVVRGGQRRQRNLVVARVQQHLLGLLQQYLSAAGADRPVTEARLTEPAAPDAAAHDFQIGPVVDNLRRGYNGFSRIDRGVEILHNALSDPLGGAGGRDQSGPACRRADTRGGTATAHRCRRVWLPPAKRPACPSPLS